MNSLDLSRVRQRAAELRPRRQWEGGRGSSKQTTATTISAANLWPSMYNCKLFVWNNSSSDVDWRVIDEWRTRQWGTSVEACVILFSRTTQEREGERNPEEGEHALPQDLGGFIFLLEKWKRAQIKSPSLNLSPFLKNFFLRSTSRTFFAHYLNVYTVAFSRSQGVL